MSAGGAIKAQKKEARLVAVYLTAILLWQKGVRGSPSGRFKTSKEDLLKWQVFS